MKVVPKIDPQNFKKRTPLSGAYTLRVLCVKIIFRTEIQKYFRSDEKIRNEKFGRRKPQNLWNEKTEKHLFSLTGHQQRCNGGVFVGRSLLEYECLRKALCEPGF